MLSLRSFAAVILCLIMVLGISVAPAYAAEETNAEQATEEQIANLKKASPEDQETVRKAAVDEATEMLCGDSKFRESVFVPVGTAGGDAEAAGDKICRDEIGKQVDKYYDTPETAITSEGPSRVAICGAPPLYDALPNAGLKRYCAVSQVTDLFRKLQAEAIINILKKPAVGNILNGAGKAVKVAQFVANPEDGFADLANYLHEEATKWTELVLGAVVDSSNFNGTEEWFINNWMGAAGIGLLILGAMFLLTLKDLGEGKVDEDETRRGLFQWGPIAVVIAVMGPQILSKLASETGKLNTAIVQSDGSDGNSVADRVGEFTTAIAGMTLTSRPEVGVILGIILFLILMLCALCLFIMFIFQEFALTFIAYGVAMCLGMLVNPRWRPYVVKMGTTWGAILASKPVMLIMLVLVFNMDFGFVSATGLDLVGQIVMVSMAMLIVAVCPWLLLRYMPMVQSPSGEVWSDGLPDMGRGRSGADSGGGPSEEGNSHNRDVVEKANSRSNSGEDSSPTSSSSSGGTDGATGPSDAGSGTSTAGQGGAQAPSKTPEEIPGTGSVGAGSTSGNSNDVPVEDNGGEQGSSPKAPGNESVAGVGSSGTGNNSKGSSTSLGGGDANGGSGAFTDTGPALGSGGNAGSGAGSGTSSAANAGKVAASAGSGGTATGILLAAQAAKKGADKVHSSTRSMGEHAVEFDLNSSPDDGSQLADGFGRYGREE